MTFIRILTEQYLMEALIDNVIKAHPDVDPSIIKHYDTHAVPEHAKPTLDWVIRQHKKGNIIPSDAHTLKPYIETYTKYKDKIGDNINKFDVNGLKDSVKRFVDKNTTGVKTNTGNEKVIHEDNDIIVKQHKGYEAAANMGTLPYNNPYHSELGGHARWCISLRGGQNKGYLSQYTNNGKHPVYSIENKHTGRKYALVADPTARVPEFRDERDNRPNMREFLGQNPSIMDTKPGKFLEQHFEDAKDYKDKFEGKNLSTLSGKDIDDLYEKHQNDHTFTNGLMSHKNVSPETLVKDYHNNVNEHDNWHKGNFPSLANKRFPSHVLDKEIDNGIKNNGSRLGDISLHAHLQPHHIDKLIKFATDNRGTSLEAMDVVRNLASNDNIKLTPEHEHTLISNFHSHNMLNDLLKKTSDNKTIKKIIEKNPHNTINTDALSNPHLNHENFYHIANNMSYSPALLGQVLNHPNLNEEITGKLIHSKLLDYIKKQTDSKDPKQSQEFKNGYLANLDTSSITGNLIRKGKLPKADQHELMDTLVTAANGTRSGPFNEIHSHLTNLFGNPHLDRDIANEGYKKLSAENKGIAYKGLNKLNDENLKDAVQSSHINAHDAVANIDFEKRPSAFDHVNLKNNHYRVSNKTLQPHMLTAMLNSHAANLEEVAKHPNAPIEIQKSVADKNKNSALHVLDRANVSPELFKHILHNKFDTKNSTVIKKLVSHTSVGPNELGQALNKINRPVTTMEPPATSKFKKDVAHEIYKRRDELSNKSYNDLTKTSVHEKTMNGLLKDNLTDEQLKNIISTNHDYFHGFANASNERQPKKHMFEQIMKHPSLGHKTLSYMMDNKEKFIPKGEENFVTRKLHEHQGQMTLEFPKGKKK